MGKTSKKKGAKEDLKISGSFWFDSSGKQMKEIDAGGEKTEKMLFPPPNISFEMYILVGVWLFFKEGRNCIINSRKSTITANNLFPFRYIESSKSAPSNENNF